jgi:O-antigen/teichoic acid export membrane protein
LGRSLLSSGAGPLLSQGLTIALVPLLFRLYTPHDFGIWATVQAIAISAGSLVSLRFDLALVLERNLEAASRLLLAVIGIVLACSAVIAVPMALSIGLLEGIGITPLGALLGWLWALFVGLNVVLQSWLMREGAFGRVSAVVVLTAVGTNLVQLAGGVYGDGIWLIGGSVAGQLVALLLNIAWVLGGADRPLRRGVSIEAMSSALIANRRFPQFSLPFTVLSLIRDRAPILIIGAFAPQALVGLYSQAWRLTYFPAGLSSAALRPVFFHRAATTGLAAQAGPVDRIARMLLIASAPWLGLVIFGRDPLFILLLGEQWQGAGSIAAMLIIPAALFTVTNWMDRLLDAAGRQDVNLKLEILAGVGSTAALALALVAGGSLTVAILFQSATLIVSYLGFLWVCYGIAGWSRRGLVLSTAGACVLGLSTFLTLSILGYFLPQVIVFAVGAIFAAGVTIALLWTGREAFK